MRHYIALIHKDPDSDFGVSFPDVPGCITAGSNLDEARAMAVEALAGHLELMREDGDDWPIPSSLETVMADPENRDGVAILVSVEDKAPQRVRVNVILPADILEEIDRYAAGQGLTRSGFLTSAAKAAMGTAHRPAAGKRKETSNRSKRSA